MGHNQHNTKTDAPDCDRLSSIRTCDDASDKSSVIRRSRFTEASFGSVKGSSGSSLSTFMTGRPNSGRTRVESV